MEYELRVVAAMHMVAIVEAASLLQEVCVKLETAVVDGGGYGVARAGGLLLDGQVDHTQNCSSTWIGQPGFKHFIFT